MTPERTFVDNNMNGNKKNKTCTSFKTTVEEIPDEGAAEDSMLGDSIPGKWKRGFT